MNRPSHWILLFLLLASMLAGVMAWIGNGERPVPIRRLTTLQSAGPLFGEGFVKDADGAFVGGIEIRVRESGVQVRSDDTGRFRIEVPRGRATLLAHDGKDLASEAEPFTPIRAHGVVPLSDIVLRKGHVVRGFLRDEAGAPLADAKVELDSPLGVRTAMTGADGAFVFGGLLPGEAALDAPGGTRPLTIGATPQDLELTAPTTRLVLVDPAHAPRPSYSVRVTDAKARRAEARSDTLGVVLLRGLGSKPWSFVVRDPQNTDVAVVRYEESEQRLVVP